MNEWSQWTFHLPLYEYISIVFFLSTSPLLSYVVFSTVTLSVDHHAEDSSDISGTNNTPPAPLGPPLGGEGGGGRGEEEGTSLRLR